jgi:hypothetical protein
VPRLPLLAISLALVVAGCAGGSAKPFVPAATASCLRQHGFSASTADARVPLVAQTAANGGLIATPKERGNTLVIGFAADTPDASNLERALRRVAPPRYRAHIRDVMTSKRNAVLLWTVSPTPEQQQTAIACLQS